MNKLKSLQKEYLYCLTQNTSVLSNTLMYEWLIQQSKQRKIKWFHKDNLIYKHMIELNYES